MFTSQEPTAQPDRASEFRPSNGPVLDPVFIVLRVWRAKFWIAALALLGLAIGVFVALQIPRVYQASTDLILDPRGINLVQNEVTQTPLGLASDAALALIQSQIAVITSSSVLGRVIDEAGLTQDPEFNGTAEGPFDRYLPSITFLRAEERETTVEGRRLVTLNNLRRAVTAGRSANSFVITVSVESRDPAKAADLANLVAATFVDEQVRAQAETARTATAALTTRLVELRQRVGQAEEAVERYRSDNRLLGIGGRLIDDEFILRINNQLANVRGEITTLNVRAESMRQTSVDDVVQGTFPEELSSPSLVRLRQTFAEVEQQNAVLSARLGPRHPQRIASEQAVASARTAIAGELARIVSSAQTELARARDTERDLTTQIEQLRGQQVETSESFVGLRELEREVDASRAIYEAYLLRSREIGEQESLNTISTRTISEATPPLQAGGSARKLIVAAGGILGFGLGLGLAILSALTHLFRTRFDPAGPLPVMPAAPANATGGFDRPVWTALPPPVRTQRPTHFEETGGVAAFDEPPRPRTRAARAVEDDRREIEQAEVEPAPAEEAVVAAPDAGPEARPTSVAERAPEARTAPPEQAYHGTEPGSPGELAAAERREKLRQRIRQIGSRRPLGAQPLDDAHVSDAIRKLARTDRPTIAEIRKRRDREASARQPDTLVGQPDAQGPG